jgi:hypothetical protein
MISPNLLYRGDAEHRPHLPLPPNWMPLLRAGRLLKRWRYVSIWSADVSICAARVSVGPVQQEFWAVWYRKGKRLWEHTRMLPGRVHLPPNKLIVRDGDTSIDITLDENEGFEVVTPVGGAYTWTRKQNGIRAHGQVRIGELRIPVEAVALIDDNAGYHPRHTVWQWSGGAGRDVNGRSVAWSVIVGLNDSPVNSERSIWIDGAVQEVGVVQFADDLSSVSFAEGGTLHFTPEAERSRSDNLLLIRSSYRQPFGAFKGTLPGGIQLTEGYGVMEFHEAWW